MRNPFSRDAFGYSTEINWKKWLLIGIPSLVLIVLIVLTILLSTGVIQVPDFINPDKEEEKHLYEPDRDKTSEDLRVYYSQSELEGREVSTRMYYEGEIKSCINGGSYIDVTYSINTSEGAVEKTANMTPSSCYVFDCTSKSASSASALKSGDKVTIYVNSENDTIPYLFMKGDGWKAIKVESVTLVGENGAKFISSDNAVKLIAPFESTSLSAIDPSIYYPMKTIRTGDIVVFKDETTTSSNQKYLTEDNSESEDKVINNKGVVRETGGIITQNGKSSYSYIDYTTSEIYVIGNHLE